MYIKSNVLYFGTSKMLPLEQDIAKQIYSVNIKVLGLESDWSGESGVSSNFYPGNDATFNTYGDFHLIPSTRPFVSSKEPITSYVTVPGSSHGDIDMSTALTGNVLYKNREGSWTFMYENHYRVATGSHDGVQRDVTIGGTAYTATGFQSPFTILDNLEKYISGREVIAILNYWDNSEKRCYKGRIWVESMTPGEASAGTVTLKYKFEPDAVSLS